MEVIVDQRSMVVIVMVDPDATCSRAVDWPLGSGDYGSVFALRS
jgi:hypothetical protein